MHYFQNDCSFATAERINCLGQIAFDSKRRLTKAPAVTGAFSNRILFSRPLVLAVKIYFPVFYSVYIMVVG
jgi:hypothetical protein